MEPTASSIRDYAAAPAGKRRRIRKGTSSCWECKRRKARCTFAGSGNAACCDGCKRRGTQCISQDLPDEPAPAGSNRHLVDRLGHVEALVGQLVKAAHGTNLLQQIMPSSATPSPPSQQVDATAISESAGFEPLRTDAASVARGSNSASPPNCPSDGSPACTQKESPTQAVHQSATVLSSAGFLAEESAPSYSSRHDYLRKELLALWPSQADFEIILSVPVETSAVVRCVTFSQPTGSAELVMPLAKTLLQLPPPGSHPVLVARKLLILVTLLQGMPSSSVVHLEHLSTSRDEMMARMVKSVHDLVTCNDDLVASVEGIECIMLEALYENYCGNFRRSWLAARRAVTIAEMLGLHRGVKPPTLNGAPFKPEYMWFRLVQLDRYLSMMMGLPQTSLDESFAQPELMENCSGPERMHRLNCVAAGRLLRRNAAEMHDPAVTKEIDRLLEEASASLPAQWWVTPNLAACEGKMDTLRETLRFNDQFMHYHMLVQLHLPYLLRSDPGRDYQYNRMTAISASREILTRFATFRTFHSAGYYCRGVDFLAFIASTALCIGHIRDQNSHDKEDCGFYFLAHQRLCDRGLLETIHQSMVEIARRSGDAISMTVATLLERLLTIEKDVAAGGRYTVTCFPESRKDDGPGCSVKLDNDETVLNICLPYMWSIKIERIPQQTSLPTAFSRYQMVHGHNNSGGISGANSRSLLSEQSFDVNEVIFQDVDFSILDTFI